MLEHIPQECLNVKGFDMGFPIINERKNELISSFSNKLVEDFSNNMDFCKQEMDKEYDRYTLELNKYIDQITEIENQENLFNSLYSLKN